MLENVPRREAEATREAEAVRAREEREAQAARASVEAVEAQVEETRAKAAEAEAEAERARAEVAEARAAAEEARARAEASSQQIAAIGLDEGVRGQAGETYQLLNDVVTGMRNNMQIAQDYVKDLGKLYEALSKADLQSLSTLDRVRLEKTMREVEPEVTLEELEALIGGSVNDAEEMKGSLRTFRDAFLNGGDEEP